jgi:Zn-dependent alcohol dehydrogenase
MHDQLIGIISFPQVLGHEVADILEEVGRNVKDFKVGTG